MTAQHMPANLRRRTNTFLTIAEVCDELGVSRSTYYDWRAARKGPHSVKLPNGEVRVRRDELEEWLRALEEPA